jgi:hypothetical protein
MRNFRLIVLFGVVLTGIVGGSVMVRRHTPVASAPATAEICCDSGPIVDPLPPDSTADVIGETTFVVPPGSEIGKAPVEADINQTTLPPQFETSATKTTVMKTEAVSNIATTAPKPKEPLRDPIAREALFFVGADPRAEEYWLDAINDPSLSGHERQDLIEDLNEDGLSDSKYPTEDDLPLILNRLALIEAVGPDAMDEVNYAAFEEAYKDLLNLADVALGGGRPVQ